MILKISENIGLNWGAFIIAWVSFKLFSDLPRLFLESKDEASSVLKSMKAYLDKVGRTVKQKIILYIFIFISKQGWQHPLVAKHKKIVDRNRKIWGNVENIKIAKNMLKSSLTVIHILLLIMLLIDGYVVKMSAFCLSFFLTNIWNYRVALLQKKTKIRWISEFKICRQNKPITWQFCLKIANNALAFWQGDTWLVQFGGKVRNSEIHSSVNI